LIYLWRIFWVKYELTIPVFNEYKDVLLRKKSLNDLKLNEKDIKSVLKFIAYIGLPYNIYFLLRPNLRDEDDNIFVELTFVSNSNFLVTSNIRDFKKSKLKFNFDIITPGEFVKYWRFNFE